MKVVAGIPSNGFWHARFGLAWSGLLATALQDFSLMPIEGQSSIVAEARNAIVRAADELGADAILFLDTDMEFPPWTLHRLASIDKPIAGATYRQRFPGGVVLGHELDGERIVIDPTQRDFREVADLPTGCMLVRRRAWEGMRRPVFRFGVDEQTGSTIGEDVLFCRRALERGMSVWLDPFLSQHVSHYGAVAFPTYIPPMEIHYDSPQAAE